VLLLPGTCCRPKLNHDLFFFMPTDTTAAAAATAAPTSQQEYHQCTKNSTRCALERTAQNNTEAVFTHKQCPCKDTTETKDA
jgi:hypothetical protein